MGLVMVVVVVVLVVAVAAAVGVPRKGGNGSGSVNGGHARAVRTVGGCQQCKGRKSRGIRLLAGHEQPPSWECPPTAAASGVGK